MKKPETAKLPSWTILIATVGERNDRFTKLAWKLLKQAEPYNGKVQLLVYWNNYEFPLAEIRQDLVDQAPGTYISFVDDDDDVPDYFVDSVMEALESKPDYVGWQQQLWHDGKKEKPTFHSLKYSDWKEDEKGWYRNVSHLNPVRSDLAKNIKFQADQNVAEDEPWAKRMAEHLKTEVYIDKVMYFYQHDSKDSVWRGKMGYRGKYYRPEIKHPYLTWYSKYGGLEPQYDKEMYYDNSYYEREIPENWFKKQGLLRPDELAAVCYAFGQPFFGKDFYKPRTPKKVYSIGCGEGYLDAKLIEMGCDVTGVDPSPGIKHRYKGKKLQKTYEGGGDTIIFCESIEHLYTEQFKEIWEKIPPCAWVIFVNWPDFHPIEPDTTGYDHVTRIDDEYYDSISYGQRIMFRRGSHLVMEKV